MEIDCYFAIARCIAIFAFTVFVSISSHLSNSFQTFIMSVFFQSSFDHVDAATCSLYLSSPFFFFFIFYVTYLKFVLSFDVLSLYLEFLIVRMSSFKLDQLYFLKYFLHFKRNITFIRILCSSRYIFEGHSHLGSVKRIISHQNNHKFL